MTTLLQRWNLTTALEEFFLSLRTIGFRRTIAVIFSRLADMAFDWRYGVETIQTESLDRLRIPSSNAAAGQRYQPTGSRALPRILRAAAIPIEGTFVDFGCGKGRTLMLAAQAGFTRVTGIEFSPELAARARENLERFHARSGLRFTADVCCQDAAHYLIQPQEQVFYFFHPFDDTVLRPVMDRIEDSLRRHPRPAWIIYYLPRHAEVIAARPHFRRLFEGTICGYDCHVYSHAP